MIEDATAAFDNSEKADVDDSDKFVDWPLAAKYISEDAMNEYQHTWELVKFSDEQYFLYVNGVLSAMFEVEDNYSINLFFEVHCAGTIAVMIWSLLTKLLPVVKIEEDNTFSISQFLPTIANKGAIGTVLGKTRPTNEIIKYAHHKTHLVPKTIH